MEENDTRPLYAMKLPRIARSAHAEPHDDEPDAPVADDIELRQYLSAKNKRCFYVYDFGDNLQHLVEGGNRGGTEGEPGNRGQSPINDDRAHENR